MYGGLWEGRFVTESGPSAVSGLDTVLVPDPFVDIGNDPRSNLNLKTLVCTHCRVALCFQAYSLLMCKNDTNVDICL